MNDPALLGKRPCSLSRSQELGWNRTWGAQASFSNRFLLPPSTSGACSCDLACYQLATVRALAASCGPGLWRRGRFQSGTSFYKKLLCGTYFLLTLKWRLTWHHSGMLGACVAHPPRKCPAAGCLWEKGAHWSSMTCFFNWKADTGRANAEICTDSTSFK